MIAYISSSDKIEFTLMPKPSLHDCIACVKSTKIRRRFGFYSY